MATLREEKEKNAEREPPRTGHRSIRGLVVVEDESYARRMLMERNWGDREIEDEKVWSTVVVWWVCVIERVKFWDWMGQRPVLGK